MKRSKYVVIGGRAQRWYTGAVTYSSLHKIGEFDTLGQAEKAAEENKQECAGLVGIFVVGDETHTESSLTSSLQKSR